MYKIIYEFKNKIMDLKKIFSKEQIDNLIKDSNPLFARETTLIGSGVKDGKRCEVQIVITNEEDDLMYD